MKISLWRLTAWGVLSALIAAGLTLGSCGQASRPGSGSGPAPASRAESAWHHLANQPAHVGEMYADAPQFDLEGVLGKKREYAFANRIAGKPADPAVPQPPGRMGWDELAAPAQPRGGVPLTLRATDELLVIERREVRPTNPGDDYPGCGSLVVTTDQQTTVPMPLERTDVSASVRGYIASVDVKQRFVNPFDTKIEAVYVFPLPEDAAVSDFLMTIGDRTIRGVIREREEARRIYEAARAAGHVASLLSQERPNIFTQRVANIEPRRMVDVSIRYFNTLAYSDGGFEFVFPMVVGPRFNPPGTADGVGAVALGATGASGQSTEVQYLRPDQRSGHDVTLTLDLDAGVSIERIESPSHAVQVARHAPQRATVTLSPTDSIPNRDFVLRWEVAGSEVKSAVLTHADERGGFFTLMLVPPAKLERLKRGPIEMVFVLDASGSMNGAPIEQAKRALERGLERLKPGDTFQLINFSNTSSQLGARPLDATPENIRRAREYVSRLVGEGGTMMVNGLRAALAFPSDGRRPRFVAFLTDGYIGNESEILRELNAGMGDARVFSFGVGSAPNRALMDAMARMGRGVAAYLPLSDSTTEVMDAFMDRVERPALTDVTLDFGDTRVYEVFPPRAPDLFVGRPVIVSGRFDGAWKSNVRISGRAGESTTSFTARVDTRALSAGRALAQVWARQKIANLSLRTMWESDGTSAERFIRQTALDFSLLSAHTSFVAVDSLTRTAGDFGVTVPVAVPVPQGVRYDTTVQEGRGSPR